MGSQLKWSDGEKSHSELQGQQPETSAGARRVLSLCGSNGNELINKNYNPNWRDEKTGTSE